MNKKGQAVFAGVMIFIMLFIVIVQFIPPIKNEIVRARSPSFLDCTNASISTSTKATCVVVDFQLFYFVGMGLAAAGVFLTARFISNRRQ